MTRKILIESSQDPKITKTTSAFKDTGFRTVFPNGISPQTPPTPPSRTPPGTPPNSPGTPDGPPPDSPVLIVDSPRTPEAISGRSCGKNGQLTFPKPAPSRPMAMSKHSPRTPEGISGRSVGNNGQLTPPNPLPKPKPTGFWGFELPKRSRSPKRRPWSVVRPSKPVKKTKKTYTSLSDPEVKRRRRDCQ